MNQHPNQTLENIAIKILNRANMPKNNNYGFASIMILMMISIMLTCIRIIQECNKSKLNHIYSSTAKYSFYAEQIQHFSMQRGWFTKMRLKKILRKELSRDDYNKYAMSIVAALLDTGESLTDEEIQTLVEAANV